MLPPSRLALSKGQKPWINSRGSITKERAQTEACKQRCASDLWGQCWHNRPACRSAFQRCSSFPFLCCGTVWWYTKTKPRMALDGTWSRMSLPRVHSERAACSLKLRKYKAAGLRGGLVPVRHVWLSCTQRAPPALGVSGQQERGIWQHMCVHAQTARVR